MSGHVYFRACGLEVERKVPLVLSETFLSQMHMKVTARLVAARRVVLSFTRLSRRQATWVKMPKASSDLVVGKCI